MTRAELRVDRRPPAAHAIATPERHATAAGRAAFGAGGNALDAALAAATTLAVTYPHNCGVGGDLFAVVRFPDGSAVSVNASGPAAAAADPDDQRTRGARMPVVGPDTITVPGAVAGWSRLHELGAARAWEAAFEHARRHAEHGIPAPGSLAIALREADREVADDPGMSGVLRPDGRPLGAGDVLRQPALARTLGRVAERGPHEFYAGPTGERLANTLQAIGSRIGRDDLAGFAVEQTPPLAGRFRDLTLLTSPPNSSGVLLLQALAALEATGDDSDWLGAGAGRLAELLRCAAAQREAMLADPRHNPVAIDAWLGDRRIAELATAIASRPPARGTLASARRAGDTVAVVAADASGLAVSLIQSLFGSLGSRVLDPATGVLLHNRGSFFSLEPGHPNELAGGKRPAHTLLPLIVERDGELAGVLGTMGGNAHAQVLAQVLLRLLSGSEPSHAVAAPRWVVGGLDPGAPDTAAIAETGVPAAAAESLARAGLHVDEAPWPSEVVGHAQAIWRSNGRLSAGSDPRADGA